MILSQALAANLSKGPTKCALHYLDKEIQYADLVKSVARFSYMFQKEIGPNARVAFIGSNCPAFVTAFFALTNNRSIVIPIDPMLSDNDIWEWLHDTRPTHVMVTSDFTNRVRELLVRSNISVPLIEVEKKHGGEYATSYVPPAGQVPTDKDPILLLRTAGTAGRYKYAIFNHLQIQAIVMGLKRTYRVGTADRFLTTLSWAHPFAFAHGMLFPMLSGSTCTIDHGLQQSEFLTFLQKSKVTRLIGYPGFFEKLIHTCRILGRNLLVKSITVSPGALDAESHKGYAEMKVKVATCYGQTENLWTITMSDVQADDEIPRGLTGFKYKVLNESGDEIPGKERRKGQLAVTGGAIMMRYEPKNEKEAEAAKTASHAVMRGTWLYTGDIFELEGDGEELKLTFVQRMDGFNPVPKEQGAFDPGAIEKAVRAQEGVTDAAALQMAGGTIICAVVRAENCTLSHHQILTTARPALVPKNMPSEIFIMTELPRVPEGDPAGEVDLAAIEKSYAESKEPGKTKAA